LFLSLINDLFPGIVLDKAGYPELEGYIQKNTEEAGLIFHPPWVLKIIQVKKKVFYGYQLINQYQLSLMSMVPLLRRD